MSIKERERQLFDRWRQERGYACFMSDGLFCEEEWNRQAVRILYVLKEANWENGDTDLCAYLLSETSPSYWKTWDNIARWTQAIRVGGEYPETVTRADKTACLKTIAALNIKKIGGDAQADDGEIRCYGRQDAAYINEQIELYQPDLIVCGGRGKGKNADILYEYVLPKTSPWQEPIRGYNYFLCELATGKRVPVVSFRHPQIRGGHAVWRQSYEAMLAIAAELKNRKYIAP